VRGWLSALAAQGYVTYDRATQKFLLSHPKVKLSWHSASQMCSLNRGVDDGFVASRS
jgi:hypothetical protein